MTTIKGTVNWGIIGCGDVCEVKSGPAFNKVPNSRLVAVMRRDLEKAKDFAHRHDVSLYFNEASEVINHPDVNAVYIATPPSSHELYTTLALRAGKPAYVEKPISTSSESCQRMIALAQECGVPVTVAHYRRELSLFRRVRSIIADGVIGAVRLVQINTLQAPSSKVVIKTQPNWRVDPRISGGGLFFDLAPHQLDIIHSLFGSPVKVNGFSLNQSGHHDAPDFTTVQLLFKNEVAFNGTWSFNVPPEAAEDQCVIIGEKGKLLFSFFKLGPLHVTTAAGTETVEMDYPVNIQLPMIEAATKYFRGEGPNPCSLEEALEGLRIMEHV